MPKPFVLPRRVQVGPIWYELQRSPGLVEKNAWGRHDGDDFLLEFSPTCSPAQLPLTLIHELVHAVRSVYGLKDDVPEESVNALANGLAQALQSLGLLPERAVLEGEDE